MFDDDYRKIGASCNAFRNAAEKNLRINASACRPDDDGIVILRLFNNSIHNGFVTYESRVDVLHIEIFNAIDCGIELFLNFGEIFRAFLL